jgi:glyoxylase-like metal-dependent hydrolase (beta-lactamase superfamily II)
MRGDGIDAVLVSHMDLDHLHGASRRRVGRDVAVLAPGRTLELEPR